MKKSLVALAALAVVGAASAQSSVTLFGVVDAAYQVVRADGNGSVSRLVQGANSSSRLGFRGTEDLGGGMSAGFWLEAGLNNDDGTGAASSSTNQTIQAFSATTGANAGVRSGTQGLTFNRRSTVSLAGGFGELRLGRDYVPAFWNLTVFDPFGTVGVGAATNMHQALAGVFGVQTAVRASNSIGYFLPNNLGGFYGQFMYAVGENASNPTGGTAAALAQAQAQKDDGKHLGLRLGYANGPLNVAGAYGTTKTAGSVYALAAANPLLGLPATFTTTGAKYDATNLAGSYNFGVATAMAVWNRESLKDDTNGTVKNTSWLLGVSVPLGAGEFKASYIRAKFDSNAAKGNQIALGYVYNLSKRTAVYTSYARISNSGNLFTYNNGRNTASFNSANPAISGNPGGSTSGLDIGLRHSF